MRRLKEARARVRRKESEKGRRGGGESEGERDGQAIRRRHLRESAATIRERQKRRSGKRKVSIVRYKEAEDERKERVRREEEKKRRVTVPGTTRLISQTSEKEDEIDAAVALLQRTHR